MTTTRDTYRGVLHDWASLGMAVEPPASPAERPLRSAEDIQEALVDVISAVLSNFEKGMLRDEVMISLQWVFQEIPNLREVA